MSDPTIRDLIRYARSVGAPLRRDRPPYHTTQRFWQCWEAEAGTRRVLVRHWPEPSIWRVDVNGRDNDDGRSIHVELAGPTIADIVAALALCGWDIGGGS